MMSIPTSERSFDLSGYLADVAVFDGLDQAILDELEPELDWVTLNAGDILFQQGEIGDSMYILVQGRLGVRISEEDGREIEVDELHAGVSVGEMGLLLGQERSATVYALADSSLVQLSEAGLNRISTAYPQLINHFTQAVLPRIQRVQLAAILTNLFGEMSVDALHALQAELKWQYLANGDAVFRQGDPGDALFIVVSGRLKVSIKEEDGQEYIVEEIAPGETVGEFSLITEEPRAATVYAIRETNVVRLPKAVFEDLIARYPQQMLQITRLIIKRQLKQQTKCPQFQPMRATTMAIVPIDETVPLKDFIYHLHSALSELGSSFWLNKAKLDEHFGQTGTANLSFDHPATIRLTHWLSEWEIKYQYILYESDFVGSTWTQRCIEQADRILLVATDSASPNLSAVEEQIKQIAPEAHTELAIVHLQPKSVPSNTQRWLAPRKLYAHHHIRWPDEAHFQRLVRRLVREHHGAVLSGGGARGFFHIGASQAFAEMGLDIDVVGGTSMGALVGAAYAMEQTPEEMVQLFQPFASRKQLLDFTVPLVSLVSTKKIATLIKSLVGDIYIEDLWRPFFCISSNITRSEPHTHTQGPLWQSLRASMAAIPMFAPSLYEGEVHVDGSYMNNFPLDIMQNLHRCRLLIGVNVSPQGQRIQPYEFGSSISGWQVLWAKLNPFAKPLPVPSILELIDRIGFLNSAYHKSVFQSLADIMITSNQIMQVSSLDFEAFAEIVAMGYHAALQELVAWQKPRC